MKISDCCGAKPIGDGCEEAGICPDCKEHCEWVELDDDTPTETSRTSTITAIILVLSTWRILPRYSGNTSPKNYKQFACLQNS